MSDSLRSKVSDHDVDAIGVSDPVETQFGERALDEIENLGRTQIDRWGMNRAVPAQTSPITKCAGVERSYSSADNRVSTTVRPSKRSKTCTEYDRQHSPTSECTLGRVRRDRTNPHSRPVRDSDDSIERQFWSEQSDGTRQEPFREERRQYRLGAHYSSRRRRSREHEASTCRSVVPRRGGRATRRERESAGARHRTFVVGFGHLPCNGVSARRSTVYTQRRIERCGRRSNAVVTRTT